uniref:Peptidase C1A papain C-terminal domain-containing protein n=1 Tax=Tetradesmus obliquus TaxID=3088 RepID=A0A383V630_TETOB|eukprot:jgi/Sobl393_1/3045/SZX61065.1
MLSCHAVVTAHAEGPGILQSYLPLQVPPGYATGLKYKGKGLSSPPNATRRGYGYIRRKRDVLANLGAGMNTSQIAHEACNTTDILERDCIDVLLLSLTPAAYSSNNTADTPGGLALISPAQKQGDCAACVGFAVTAAAEAANNVYKQQSWQKLNLSEQDLCFCKEEQAVQWASRDCFKFTFRNDEDCFPVSAYGACSGPGASQMPPGGRLSVAYNGNALSSMAMVKEQIMLNGGVFTSMALSGADFVRFVDYKTAASGVFTAAQSIPAGADQMHAVFCYGWWDNPRSESDGYWLCKNSWSEAWGLRGSFKIAYGSAYIMQSDYTFALQYAWTSITAQATQIKQRLVQGSLMRDAGTPGCVMYTAPQRIRLVKLTADLTTLAFTAALPALHMRKAEVLTELVASNLGHLRSLSAASRGPFKLCGRTVQLLSGVLFSGDLNNCVENVEAPACQRCARQIAAGHGHTCVLLNNGRVECAGYNAHGELGLGRADKDTHSRLAPATVLDGINISSVGVGDGFTCVLGAPSEGNKVYCFGFGGIGQLGNGLSTSSVVPVAVKGLRQSLPIKQLAVGISYACVVYDAPEPGAARASVQCWGEHFGTTLAQAEDLVDSAEVTALAASWLGPCAVLKNRTAVCWHQEVLYGGEYNPTPRDSGLTDVDSRGGEVYCWGANNYGQLGQGYTNGTVVSYIGSSTPLRVKGLSYLNVTALFGGDSYCAVTAAQRVFCWGDNQNGMLGIAASTDAITLPAAMQGLCA